MGGFEVFSQTPNACKFKQHLTKMTKLLKGKIIWIQDDFAYIGANTLKNESTSHIVARIENAIIDDYMIKFYVCPHVSSDKQEWSYNVNLLINETGTSFKGTFSEATESSYKGEVFCELFSNKKKYMLHGRWLENDALYTFWAIFDIE
jgi:hypothetical protein